MRITNFEATGLNKVSDWIGFDACRSSLPLLRDVLKSCNISFVLEDINRVQSTLLCELNDSYVQQSQRYVTMNSDGYSLPDFTNGEKLIVEKIIGKAFNLYSRMSELSDLANEILASGKGLGRPKPEYYKHGISIEDARYILPLATKTNISIAMSGDKLIDLYALITDFNYYVTFGYDTEGSLMEQLNEFIPKNIIDTILCHDLTANEEAAYDFYKEYFSMIDNDNKVVLIDRFENPELKVGLGALTSTSAKAPSEVLVEWGDDATEKARGVGKRVLGIGHTGVNEQARAMFGQMSSLVTYHQQIRHRLPKKQRELLAVIINDIDREVVIPESIKNSVFVDEYLELVREFKDLRISWLRKGIDIEYMYPLLLNCEQIKMIMSTNARIDCEMFNDRTCMTAQWEIRELTMKKLKIQRSISSVLYESSLPPCVQPGGKCKEGKLTCGKQELVKEIFSNL